MASAMRSLFLLRNLVMTCFLAPVLTTKSFVVSRYFLTMAAGRSS